jgi:hypothetical protein
VRGIKQYISERGVPRSVGARGVSDPAPTDAVINIVVLTVINHASALFVAKIFDNFVIN